MTTCEKESDEQVSLFQRTASERIKFNHTEEGENGPNLEEKAQTFIINTD